MTEGTMRGKRLLVRRHVFDSPSGRRRSFAACLPPVVELPPASPAVAGETTGANGKGFSRLRDTPSRKWAPQSGDPALSLPQLQVSPRRSGAEVAKSTDRRKKRQARGLTPTAFHFAATGPPSGHRGQGCGVRQVDEGRSRRSRREGAPRAASRSRLARELHEVRRRKCDR
jgi:hypothetical protein